MEEEVGPERLQRLLAQGLEGDSRSYRDFLVGLTGYLRSFLLRRLSRRPDEVEDLVQESLLAIHNKLHTYDRDLPLAAWVHAIAKYKLVDFLRRRQLSIPIEGSLSDGIDFFSSTNMDAAEARRDLLKLLEQLPEGQRRPIVHTKLEGLSVEEAARLTGMSPSAVKVGVHRGLKALAAKMRDT